MFFLLYFLPLSVNAYIPDEVPAFSAQKLAPGQLLIASDTISTGIFKQSVILLTKHDQSGTVGLIINRPSTLPLKEVIPEWVADNKAASLFVGGPVHQGVMSVLLQSQDEPKGLTRIMPMVFHKLGINNENIGKLISPANTVVRFYSGYAGWTKGQLASEINTGGWYVIDANPRTLFVMDLDSMWQDLIQKAGGKYK